MGGGGPSGQPPLAPLQYFSANRMLVNNSVKIFYFSSTKGLSLRTSVVAGILTRRRASSCSRSTARLPARCECPYSREFYNIFFLLQQMERMINRSVEDCGCLPWNFPKLPGNKYHIFSLANAIPANRRKLFFSCFF